MMGQSMKARKSLPTINDVLCLLDDGAARRLQLGWQGVRLLVRTLLHYQVRKVLLICRRWST